MGINWKTKFNVRMSSSGTPVGLGYGDFRDRDGRAAAIGVKLPQFPPAPHAVHSVSRGHLIAQQNIQPPNVSLSQKLTERVEHWFGSVDRFSHNAVEVSRRVVVDCLAYPYTVFCRQCQVFPYNAATVSISAPFSTTVVLHHIAQTQGVRAWWRGWYSYGMLTMARPFLNAVLSRTWRQSQFSTRIQRITRSFCTTSVTHAATIPLLSYVFLEMVQTTRDKVYTGLLEVLRERPFLLVDKFRRMPYLYLVMPTILHGLAAEVISHLSITLLQKLLPNRTQSQEQQDVLSYTMRALWVAYFSSLFTDAVLYPLTTVLVRLYCQGMPVLVDNVQTGTDVVFISTYYSGFVDSVFGIWDTEGPWGFYKGFSSLLLQYIVHGGLLLILWRTVVAIRTKLD